MDQLSYIEKFERVVDLLRTTGSYTAILNTGNIYDVTSNVDTYLEENDYITLEGISVRVVAITADKIFQVNTFGASIALSGTWKALAPYSDYGTKRTINVKLNGKNGGEYSYQKYPLIALRLPTEIKVVGASESFEANILIAHFTSKQYRPEERIANKFKPILWPLKDLFLDMVIRSGEFNSFNADYSWIDRLFYGQESGGENIANVFDDPLDAVEIRNLHLNYFKDC